MTHEYCLEELHLMYAECVLNNLFRLRQSVDLIVIMLSKYSLPFTYDRNRKLNSIFVISISVNNRKNENRNFSTFFNFWFLGAEIKAENRNF